MEQQGSYYITISSYIFTGYELTTELNQHEIRDIKLIKKFLFV